MGNINLQHNFNDAHQISLDADYLKYRDENPNTYGLTYVDSQGNVLSQQNFRSGKITPLEIAVAKADYTGSLGDHIKIGSGVKAVVSSFTNDVAVEEQTGGQWTRNPTFTSKSDLNESIYAAYASVDYQIDEKTGLKFGLRYEYTDSNLGTEEQDNIVDREFGSWFPSMFFSREINQNNSFNLSYSKRITRPTFSQMAPFVIFFDPNTFFSGNAAIQPAISNAVKFDYRHKTMLLSLQYTHEDSTIVRFQDRVDPETNTQIIESSNLKNRKTFAVTLAIPAYVTNWWEMQNNFIYLNQEVNSWYDGSPVNLKQNNFRMNSVQSFKLSKSWTFELSGFYQSKAIWGTAVLDAFGGVNAGLEKKFGDKWGTLRLAVNDIFNTIKYSGGTVIPGQDFETYGTYDFSRTTVKLVYSRNFGNNKLKTRKRSTGSDEERRRVE
jgi:hypothetical protein